MNKAVEPKTVLVTGGSGFIGGMVCRLLVSQGHEVINIDRKKSVIEGVTMYPFDLETRQLRGVIKMLRPDTIMHLAADHEVGRSVAEPGVFYWNNVANTIALLNYAADAGVKNFVFSSSSSVYGNITTFPTTETEARNPVSPYGKSKMMVEDLLEDYKQAYGINYTALRYFNAAGADPDLRHGYTQDPASHLIPIICRAVIAGKTLKVYGNDYPTIDGTCVRDYTHVYDIAEAHLSAMAYLSNGGESGVFNIGAGKGSSILEVIKTFEEVTGQPVSFEIDSRREGDPAATYADITKSRTAFGWEPKYGLTDIVRHAYLWEKKAQKIK